MAKLIEAEALIKKAKTGEMLSPDQRRHAVGYLMSNAMQRVPSNMEMAEMFRVDEKTIRRDRDHIRKQASELVKEEDIALVISDIILTYERYCERIERQIAKLAKEPSRLHLDYENSLISTKLRVVDALQSLGWYPKNLGQLTKKTFEFKAVVTKDGTVDTRDVAMLDHLIETPSTDQERREALDAEFMDMPQLPAAPETNAPEIATGVGAVEAPLPAQS
jgi:hypothetical protein